MTDRILRNTAPTLQATFYIGETATPPSPNTATVTVTRADGTAIVTGAAATNAGTGIFSYVLDETYTANLDLLTLDWTATFSGNPQVVRTYCEIVGGFYVSLAEIRALPGLSSTTSFTTATLGSARNWFEDLAEEFCGVAFVPRYGRELFDGCGQNTIRLKGRGVHQLRKLLSVKVDGVSKTLTDFVSYPTGKVYWKAGSFSTGYQNVEINYEHGHDKPDEDLRQAALAAIQTKLLGDMSGIPDRAISMTTDTGTYGLSLAGAERPTGIPAVDAVLKRKNERLPLTA